LILFAGGIETLKGAHMKNIEAIISDLEQQRRAIDQALEALRQVGGQPAKRRGRPPGTKNSSEPKRRGGKRYISPEGKKRIADAARRRWAEIRAAKKKAA
jgi:hypothetical protein